MQKKDSIISAMRVTPRVRLRRVALDLEGFSLDPWCSQQDLQQIYILAFVPVWSRCFPSAFRIIIIIILFLTSLMFHL